MKKTFQEKIIDRCRSRAGKNKWLKYPCLLEIAVLLIFYHLGRYLWAYLLKPLWTRLLRPLWMRLWRHIASNGRRYVGIAFAFMFFMSSCSFSFAVFTRQTSFISTQEPYNAIIEDSDAELAVEKEVPPDEDMLLETEETAKEYNDIEDIENADFYTLDDILEETDYTAPEETAGTEKSISEIVSEAVFDSGDWRLLLVNKQHPIPEDYSFNLGIIKGSMQCDERIIADLLAMMQAAKGDGINLEVCSPYRTDGKQEWLFDKKIKTYMSQGYSYMDAYKAASQIVTIPGSSEHQIGLALDIYSDTHKTLDEAFEDTEAGKWLAAHSYEYGFVLRYPEGKEYITSIEYEPWHFRYVGREAAAVMHKEDLCLEEFWDKYL
ncbi:MAG: M15 family metallopeptidase [Blautia sp.]|nr:M15 family metallopeptidase [Blautia sp.]MCM1201901.1 M15 family metallopeptidase [Bacteroides fragilis]